MDFGLRNEAVYSSLVEGNVIPLYTPKSDPFESFYLCITQSFGVANEVLTDKYNHYVTVGEKCIASKYLQKVPFKLGSRTKKYKLLPDIVHVDPIHVVSPHVNLGPNYSQLSLILQLGAISLPQANDLTQNPS